MSGDNCAVNKRFGSEMPLIGWASHRLHLASMHYLDTHGMSFFKARFAQKPSRYNNFKVVML